MGAPRLHGQPHRHTPPHPRILTPPAWIAADVSTDAAPPRKERIRALLDGRLAIIEGAAADVEQALHDVADQLAAELRQYLAARANGDDMPSVRLAVHATKLNDIVALLRGIGADGSKAGTLDAAQQAWVDALGRLADEAEKSLGAQGIPDASRILDGEAAQAALLARYEDADSLWRSQVVQPMGQRILDGLRSNLLAPTLSDAVAMVAKNEGRTIANAVTEVRTQTAEFDRWASAESAAIADPDGERIMWAYTGPDDGIERPFCDVINGYFFTRAQVARLDNSQIGSPAFNGGGYNCRHQWVHATRAVTEALGYEAGDDSRVQRANDAAARRR